MLCFTGSERPTGGNISMKNAGSVNLPNTIVPIGQSVNGLIRGKFAINSTDFTKDEYQFGTARGVQYAHDHFFLPV